MATGVMAATVEVLESVLPEDPSSRPCTVLGKKCNLKSLDFEKVKPFFGDKVTKEVRMCVCAVCTSIVEMVMDSS